MEKHSIFYSTFQVLIIHQIMQTFIWVIDLDGKFKLVFSVTLVALAAA